MTRIILFITFVLISTSCTKDVGIKPVSTAAPNPLPTPFVEYRDPFLGSYQGTMAIITQTSSTNYTTVIIDTTVVSNIACISKSSSNDSTLIIANPSADYDTLPFRIRPTGYYNFSNYQHTQGPYFTVFNSSIKFINDSVYIYVYSLRDITYRITFAHSRTYFSGKKQ